MRFSHSSTRFPQFKIFDWYSDSLGGSVDEIKVREKTSIIISISSYCSYEGMRVAL